jgi:hypothetical protein
MDVLTVGWLISRVFMSKHKKQVQLIVKEGLKCDLAFSASGENRRCSASGENPPRNSYAVFWPFDHMSRAFAIVLGISFVAAGLAKTFLASTPRDPTDIIFAPLFLGTGIACFFHRNSASRRQSR